MKLPQLQPNKGLAVPAAKERCYICQRQLVAISNQGKETKICPIHSTAGVIH